MKPAPRGLRIRIAASVASVTASMFLALAIVPAATFAQTSATEAELEKKLENMARRVAGRTYYMPHNEHKASRRNGACQWTYKVDSWLAFDATGMKGRQTSFYSRPSDDCAYAVGYSHGAIVRLIELQVTELMKTKGYLTNAYGRAERDLVPEWQISAWREVVASPNTSFFTSTNGAIGDQDYVRAPILGTAGVRFITQPEPDVRVREVVMDFDVKS